MLSGVGGGSERRMEEVSCMNASPTFSPVWALTSMSGMPTLAAKSCKEGKSGSSGEGGREGE